MFFKNMMDRTIKVEEPLLTPPSGYRFLAPPSELCIDFTCNFEKEQDFELGRHTHADFSDLA